jgi:hypothetical protein
MHLSAIVSNVCICICVAIVFYFVRFRFIAILASIVGASAFAPMGRVARSSAMKMGYENELGAMEPMGYFDPL